MLVYTTLYEITGSESELSQESLNEIFDIIRNELLQKRFKLVALENENDFPIFALFSNKEKFNTTIMLSLHSHFITIDFQEDNEKEDLVGHRTKTRQFHRYLSSALPKCKINRMTPLVRGKEIWNYSELGDGRIVEESYEEIIYREKSKYQEISIARCKENGNTLILNGVENISEKNDTYTPALLGLNQGYDFSGKTVLILGGGDGAALNLLRQLSPSMVTMVEIDEKVLQVCKKYLRGRCGDSLDNYAGENYQIVIGDCIEYLKYCQQKQLKFDYVISDITDVPIDQNIFNTEVDHLTLFGDVEYDTKFFYEVFNLSLKVLQPYGVILTHVGSASNKVCLESFISKMKTLNEETEIEISVEHVPVFHENWVFGQIKRTS